MNQQQWIDVKQKLPEEYTLVLCYKKYDNFLFTIDTVLMGEDQEWEDDEGKYITHWMSLPSGPNEESDLTDAIESATCLEDQMDILLSK